MELTDGSKWRIWPGDLANTLGWTSEAEIEVLPIDEEFCSHILVDHTDGSRGERSRQATIGPWKSFTIPSAMANDLETETPTRNHAKRVTTRHRDA